jgi:hypothetical protein
MKQKVCPTKFVKLKEKYFMINASLNDKNMEELPVYKVTITNRNV